MVSSLAMTAYLNACPLCQEAVGRANAGLAKGYNWSIFLMLGMTFGAVAVITAVIARAYRKRG